VIESRLALLRPDSPARPVFTGERFVPGQAGARIAYEHLHRYAFARRFVAGRRVLDLGCGLGYGAEVLAPFARDVVALDRDVGSVREARAVRTHALGPFVAADATRLPLCTDSFDVVIAFELIEHLTEQEALVAEIRRVLRPAGLLVVSSPDTAVYSGKLGQRNPFHPKEMTTEELRRLLEPHFDRLLLYKQRVIVGSMLVPDGAPRRDGAELLVARLETEPPAIVLDPSEPDFVYNVVVCGPAEAVADAPGGSVLADVGETLTVETERSLESTREVVHGLERSVKEWEGYAAQIIRDKDAYLEQFVRAKDEVIARLQHAMEERQEAVTALEAAVAARDERLGMEREALAKAVDLGNANEGRAATLRADVARLEAELGAAREREAVLESELAQYRTEPVVRRYLDLKRLMRGGGPQPSRRSS
jgi:SAM-dependent methyltransferase